MSNPEFKTTIGTLYEKYRIGNKGDLSKGKDANKQGNMIVGMIITLLFLSLLLLIKFRYF